MMNLKIPDDAYVVILGGGCGQRLWPLSRKRSPKQFIRLGGGKSFLEQTVSRLLGLFSMDRILVCLPKEYTDQVREHVPDLPEENLLIEPARQGTGPAVLWSAAHISKSGRDPIMLTIPADHVIQNESVYLNSLAEAARLAEETGNLVALGLSPTHPATAYGYLCLGEELPLSSGLVRRVDRFQEKPGLDEAAQLLEKYECLWNMGTFAWKISSLEKSLDESMSVFADALRQLAGSNLDDKKVEDIYGSLPKISIEHALMEKTHNLIALKSDCDRIDVGDLKSLAHLLPEKEFGNISEYDLIQQDSRDNIVFNPGRLTALIGVRDLIVMVTDDVVLVCDKKDSQAVREIVKKLENSGKSTYA